jgi:hypothetical protein
VFNLRWHAVQSLTKLGRHLQQEQPDSPQLAEITAVFRDVLQEFQTQPLKIVREALTGYGELGDATGAAVLFPLLADSRFNIDGIVAVLTILTRHRENAYDVVRAYLPWRAANDRLPTVPESPDRALVGFCLYLQTSGGYDPAGKAVAAALAQAQAEMPEPSHRELARGLLADFLVADDGPAIDPAADPELRAAQLQRWQQWWEQVRDEFRLTAGHLGRPVPTP